MKGYFKQDESHWYFIPSENVEDFNRLMEATEGKYYGQAADAFDEFNDKFSQCRIDGGPESYEVDFFNE